jgi:C-methyltransferase C-terminal domain/Putative zinc binding domain/Methyltransferase domain
MSVMTSLTDVQQQTAAKPCRFCGSASLRTFVDLGMSPLCQTAPSVEDLNKGEIYYPLHVYVCERCFLVQLDVFEQPENIFGNYLYFSSYSDSWLKHCENYCEMTTKRFGLNPKSFVVEVASNDGYLLQYFVRGQVPALGIEPAENVAKVAIEKGVPTISKFFGTKLAKELVTERGGADLVLGNNVLAQVPDLNDFVEGLKILLKPSGVLTLEFPHLLRLMELNEFDTIYHEHFSYFSFLTTIGILKAHGLRVFDVEELSTHGGSLRIFACRAEDATHKVQPSVEKVIGDEKIAGLDSVRGYAAFAAQVQKTKFALLDFLLTAAQEGKSVAGYGAPGKSATLLHYCGIGKDLIQYTVDRSPHKQGRFLPGSRIPIYHPDRIAETKPDYVIILPWNLKDEIMRQLHFIREWGGRFVVPIPKVAIY